MCVVSSTSASPTTGSRSWTASRPWRGERGRVFLVELAEAAGHVLKGLARSAEGPPAKLAPVFRHGIAPGEVADAAVPEYLRSAGLDVLASGDLPLVTTERSGDGTRIELPSKWIVAGRQA